MSSAAAGFDPMGEAFRSQDNAYPGLADDQQPWYRGSQRASQAGDPADDLATSRAHELHVNNIPPNLTGDGLRNLFSKYGKVLDAKLSK